MWCLNGMRCFGSFAPPLMTPLSTVLRQRKQGNHCDSVYDALPSATFPAHQCPCRGKIQPVSFKPQSHLLQPEGGTVLLTQF